MKPHFEQTWLKTVFTNDKGGYENFGWKWVIHFLSANQWEESPWNEAHKAFHKKKTFKTILRNWKGQNWNKDW